MSRPVRSLPIEVIACALRSTLAASNRSEGRRDHRNRYREETWLEHAPTLMSLGLVRYCCVERTDILRCVSAWRETGASTVPGPGVVPSPRMFALARCVRRWGHEARMPVIEVATDCQVEAVADIPDGRRRLRHTRSTSWCHRRPQICCCPKTGLARDA